MKDKDNISDFSEMKKLLEKKEAGGKDLFSDLQIDRGDLSEILQSLGISTDNNILKEMLNNPDIDSMVDHLRSGVFSYQDIQDMLANFKTLEERFKKEKKTYRAFGQWVAYHKPYDLSTLCSVEQIRTIAKQIGIQYDKMDSKNNMIDKIKPHLNGYLTELFLSLDDQVMSHVGRVICSDGKLLAENLFTEEEEGFLDFLQKKSILYRVNEGGKHYLLIPKEFYEEIIKMNFDKIGKYNRLNSIINQTAIAFSNSYGAYPRSLLVDHIRSGYEDLINDLEDLSFEEYIEKHLAQTFSKTYSFRTLYPSVIITDDYISHGVVEFTKYLIDIQNETITDYKKLTEDQIKERGKTLYYDDTIYLKQALDILLQFNTMDRDETDQVKNLIYIFSYLEFEPSIVMQMLEMRYQLPDDREYTKLTDILRNYYKNSEKWILKGHTSFEVNNSKKSFDASKIVKIDFMKKQEE